MKKSFLPVTLGRSTNMYLEYDLETSGASTLRNIDGCPCATPGDEKSLLFMIATTGEHGRTWAGSCIYVVSYLLGHGKERACCLQFGNVLNNEFTIYNI